MPKPFVIGVSGCSGSGKTHFLKLLRNYLPEESASFVSQDNYYKPKEFQQKDSNGKLNFDLPESIDHQQFITDIENLLAGNSIKKPAYTFNNPAAIPTIITVQPSPLVIIEGLFIYHFAEIAAKCDLKIFIEADQETALKRRIERDARERGYNEETVRYQWLHHVEPAYFQYLLPYKSSADSIIYSDEKMEKEIKELVKKIKEILNG